MTKTTTQKSNSGFFFRFWIFLQTYGWCFAKNDQNPTHRFGYFCKLMGLAKNDQKPTHRFGYFCKLMGLAKNDQKPTHRFGYFGCKAKIKTHRVFYILAKFFFLPAKMTKTTLKIWVVWDILAAKPKLNHWCFLYFGKIYFFSKMKNPNHPENLGGLDILAAQN